MRRSFQAKTAVFGDSTGTTEITISSGLILSRLAAAASGAGNCDCEAVRPAAEVAADAVGSAIVNESSAAAVSAFAANSCTRRFSVNFALSLKHFPAHINGSSQRMKKFLSPALEIERAVPI